MKTVDIKGKPYIEVNERLKFFRTSETFKNYSLESEIIELNNGTITIKATIRDANERIVATGLAQEKESSSFINKTSFVENCETSAWGRALGNLGIGIDTSVASAEEVSNAILNQEIIENKTKKQKKITSQTKPIKQQPQVIENNDIDILEGMKGCSDLNNLQIYFKKYYKQVVDIDAYIALKDEIKTKLSKKEVENEQNND